MAGTLIYKWTDGDIASLIKLKSQYNHLVSGKKNTKKKAWEGILQQIGLQGKVSSAQVAKKWDNLKQKYKELRRSATGAGTDRGEVTAATWPWFTAMHEAVSRGKSIRLPVLMDSSAAENLAHVADEAADVSGSSPGSVAATCSEMFVVEVEEDDTQAFPPYSWTDEEIARLIRLRSQNIHLVTGKRNTKKKAWEGILQQIGLQGKVSSAQVAKKWNNLKQKYKELRRSATGAGADGGEVTAATWPWFTAMHEAITGEKLVSSPVLVDLTVTESPLHVADKAFSPYPWTVEETARFIQLRSENDHIFTGKRHTSKKAWQEILQQMGLQSKVSPVQAAKKWDNLKHKYKELRRSTKGAATDIGEVTAATWPWFTAMHEAVSRGKSIRLPVLMDSSAVESSAHAADEAADVSGSSPGSVAATCSEMFVVEVEDDDTQAFPHTWTVEETISLIRLRSENDHLFSRKKHTAKKAWRGILQQMGLQAQVSPTQAAKKWDNLKQKYKELRRSAMGTGLDLGDITAATRQWYTVMAEAFGGGEPIDPLVLMESRVAENPAPVADESSGASHSSPHESVTASCSQECVEQNEVEEEKEEEEDEEENEEEEDENEEDDEDAKHFSPYPWSQVETLSLILLRSESNHLFNGRKHTAKKAWECILQQMGLKSQVSSAQAAEKWDNLKQKYEDLHRSATGTGMVGDEATAANWPWFAAMHDAIGKESYVAENPAHVADEASDASGSSSPGSAAYSVVCVEVEGEGEKDKDEAQPGSSSVTQEDSEPCDCPPSPKRRRTCQGDILEFLKEEAAKEEERFRAALESTNRFLDLFERLVNKL